MTNQTVEVVNHTKSTQPNPPITELNTITIATATYTKRELRNFQIFFTLDIASAGDITPKCICCFLKLKRLWVIGNRTSCCSILPVIILVINKSDFRSAVVQFCLSLVWLQSNWTPLSPITVTKRNTLKYASWLILRWKRTLGLANPVPGPSKGMLFRAASIFVVVVWGAEPENLRKLF